MFKIAVSEKENAARSREVTEIKLYGPGKSLYTIFLGMEPHTDASLLKQGKNNTHTHTHTHTHGTLYPKQYKQF